MSVTRQSVPSVSYTPIGFIYSGHKVPEETPIQPVYAAGCTGTVEVYPEYQDGLSALDGFSHVILIYHFHRAGSPLLRLRPFLMDRLMGVFATRAPSRPNAIGLSIVRLKSHSQGVLVIEDVDVLDGTPLLDIKPYVSRFDCITDARSGWQDEVDEASARKLGVRGFRPGSEGPGGGRR